MKIGLLGLDDNFRRDTGTGIPVYMYELLTNLKKLEKRNNMQVEKLGYERKSPEIVGFLSLVLESAFQDLSNFDILHNLDVKPIYPLNKGKAIYVCTAHDYQPLLDPELDADMETTLKNKVKLALEIRYSLRLSLKADYLISRSTLTKQDAIKLGFDGKKIFVVGGAVDDRYRTPLPRTNRKNFTVGYIGAFRTRKNVSFAINSFKKIKDDKIRFTLWGKPSYEYTMLRELAGRNKNIEFKGFAPEKDMVKIYDSFDVFLFPSLYEGLCLPIFEAQARGLPVVIYKHSRVPEETRRYCLEAKDEDDAAAIIEKIKRNGYNEKLRREAMEYARSLTWEKTTKQTLEAYNKILKS